MLDMVDSQISIGWKAKSGAISNPKALFQTGQGKVIYFNPGFELSDAEKIDPPNIPESMFALQEEFNKDMIDMVDIANMGASDTDRMSSVLFQMKQGLSMLSLGDIFENLRESQYHLSRKVLKMIQNYTPEKVERIIKQQPTPEFYNRTFLKYDVQVGEAVMTDTQKQMAFLQAFSMKAAGVQVPDDMLMELSPSPIAKKFMDRIRQQAEQAEAAAQQELEDKKQINELLQAKAFSDVSLGEERLSKIKYDAALSEERLAAAQEERARSALDIVRASKEFADMDMSTAQKFVDMVLAVEESERAKSEDTVVEQPMVKK